MGLYPDMLPFFFVYLFIEVVKECVLFLGLDGVEGGEGGLEGVGVEGDFAEGIFDSF